MAENKKSFIAYCDWLETFEALPDEKAGQLIKDLLRYVNDLNPETDDILIKAVFANIKHTLKRDLKKYEQIREKRAEAGKMGGRPKKQNEAKKANGFFEKQTKAKKADNVNDNDSVNDNVINKNIPAFDDFKNYVLENEPNIDLKALELKYKSWIENDWKDGNNKPIKKWKSKILNTIQFLPKNLDKKQANKLNLSELIK